MHNKAQYKAQIENDLEYALKNGEKNTCNWSTASTHQDYPPKISPKSKCLHTCYALTHAIVFQSLFSVFYMVAKICNAHSQISIYFCWTIIIISVSATWNLRNSAVCHTATNQQWPNKTNDWSKFIHKWLKKCICIQMHIHTSECIAHLKYLHIIYSKCVPLCRETRF